jgi:hypothetical protein
MGLGGKLQRGRQFGLHLRPYIVHGFQVGMTAGAIFAAGIPGYDKTRSEGIFRMAFPAFSGVRTAGKPTRLRDLKCPRHPAARARQAPNSESLRYPEARQSPPDLSLEQKIIGLFS